ncbi:POC1 centriolar protein A, partial [Ceratobasidium sp. 392]
MLLTAAAGAGKTTIAHTVAQRCATAGQLGSSFFFDRETEGRNTPTALFATMSADICRLDSHVAEAVIAAIEKDWSLPSAPIARQFEELVLKPFQKCRIAGPVVIVIDALDEAWDDCFVNILRRGARNLPSTFRLFLTSRMQPELASLCRQPHVTRINLDITTQPNLLDISKFVKHKLSQLIDERDLEDDWPGEDLTLRFVEKAGGLFQWVATVCDYLRHRDDPTWELNELVSRTDLSTTSAEARMDKLYATILGSFDWSDTSFVTSYRRVMGAAIASKTPLTILDLKRLYHNEHLASDYTLQRLSPLLTGMSKADHASQPVRVLHQSLRDFLVFRAGKKPCFKSFRISEKAHSQKLAALCLGIMNRDLNENIPNTGYLAEVEDESFGIP